MKRCCFKKVKNVYDAFVCSIENAHFECSIYLIANYNDIHNDSNLLWIAAAQSTILKLMISKITASELNIILSYSLRILNRMIGYSLNENSPTLIRALIKAGGIPQEGTPVPDWARQLCVNRNYRASMIAFMYCLKQKGVPKDVRILILPKKDDSKWMFFISYTCDLPLHQIERFPVPCHHIHAL